MRCASLLLSLVYVVKTGTFQNLGGMTNCTVCQKGKASSQQGQKFCQDCDSGYYSDADGLTLCVPCFKGERTPPSFVS